MENKERNIIIGIAAVALVLLVGVAAWLWSGAARNNEARDPEQNAGQEQNQDRNRGQEGESGGQDAEPRTVTEPNYRLTLPAGWERAEGRAGIPAAEGAETAHLYRDPATGNYFAVVVNALGRGVSADSVWETTPSGNGFEVARQSELCLEGKPFCSAGDERLDILIKGGEIAGKRYVFFAGNTQREAGVNQDQFETILRSFQAK